MRKLPYVGLALCICIASIALSVVAQTPKPLLNSTSQDSLVALVGQDTYNDVMRLAEALPQEDIDRLLSIGDEPY
jgi:hypothetical protein